MTMMTMTATTTTTTTTSTTAITTTSRQRPRPRPGVAPRTQQQRSERAPRLDAHYVVLSSADAWNRRRDFRACTELRAVFVNLNSSVTSVERSARAESRQGCKAKRFVFVLSFAVDDFLERSKVIAASIL
jgi:hypothetical protein